MVLARRDLSALPKAHLHLHFTGSLDPATLAHLGEHNNVHIPPELLDLTALSVEDSRRGWFKFQRHYDVARRAVKGEYALRAVVDSAARRDAAHQVRRLELQIDPSSYAPSVGGLHAVLEIVLDEAKKASDAYGICVAIVVAASRLRHPMDARTLARLAVQYAGDGPGEVVAFGLNNDEEVGDTPEWEGAFRIAKKGGLRSVPHGGELRGAEHLAQVVTHLGPDRIGHGVRAVEDPDLMHRIIDAGIAFEVCPASNVQLGVYSDPLYVPVDMLVDAGATVALGADDPLLFVADLTAQYELVRHQHDFSDEQLANLAKASFDASFAPEVDKRRWRSEVDAWLAAPPD